MYSACQDEDCVKSCLTKFKICTGEIGITLPGAPPMGGDSASKFQRQQVGQEQQEDTPSSDTEIGKKNLACAMCKMTCGASRRCLKDCEKRHSPC